MKTLIYGNLKIDLDLDPRQEEILKQTLLEDVKAIQKHQEWLRREASRGSDSPVKDIKPSKAMNKPAKVRK